MKKSYHYFSSLLLIIILIVSVLINFINFLRNRRYSEHEQLKFTYLLTKYDSNCSYKTKTGVQFVWPACNEAELGQVYSVTGRLRMSSANSFFDYFFLDVSDITKLSNNGNSLNTPFLLFYRMLLKSADLVSGRLIVILHSWLHTEPASLVVGLVLGSQKADFSPDFRSLVKSLGLSHMVAVSGFHLGVLSVFISDVFSFVRSPKIRFSIIVVLLFWYCLIVSSPLSILRAFLMFSLSAIGRNFFKRPINSLYVLFQVLVLMICFSPFYLGNTGFQLSFLSTFGILLFGGLDVTGDDDFILRLDGFSFSNYFSLFISLIKQSILTSFYAQLTSLPFLISTFGEVAPWGFLSTLLFSAALSFLISFSVPLLLIAFTTSSFSGLHFVLLPLFCFLDDFVSWIIGILRLFAHYFGLLVKIDFTPTISHFLVYYGFLCAVGFWLWRRRFRVFSYVS